MVKPKSAHKIVKELLREGYSYRELALFYKLSPSTLHNMQNNLDYNESAKLRDLLNSKRPTFVARRNK